MKRRSIVLIGATAAFVGVPASSAMAAPPERAGEDAFVCPVLTLPDKAVETGRFNPIGDGQYTFGPGNAGSADTFKGNVPIHATNAEGEGTPGSDHVAPGDAGYTAIWSGDQDPPN